MVRVEAVNFGARVVLGVATLLIIACVAVILQQLW